MIVVIECSEINIVYELNTTAHARNAKSATSAEYIPMTAIDTQIYVICKITNIFRLKQDC